MLKHKWGKASFYVLAITLLLLPAGQSVAAPKWAVISTMAGDDIRGSQDGVGKEAQFRLPGHAVSDKEGNVYVADTGNHLIRKVTSDGDVHTIAGQLNKKDEYGQWLGGDRDGPALHALFNEPRGLALSTHGDLYIADAGNGKIRKLNEDGYVSTYASDLAFPSDIIVDQDGNLYVSESLAHRIVKITPDGERYVLAGGGYEQDDDGWLTGGFVDGVGEAAQFNEPNGLELASDGTIYIADTGNQRIRALSVDGEVRTVAGTGNALLEDTSYIAGGYVDGQADQARFNFPNGLAITEDGTILVADTMNHLVREIDPKGVVRTIAGNGSHGRTNGYAVKANFDQPSDVVLLSDGSIVIVDQWNHHLRLLTWNSLPAREAGEEGVRIALNDHLSKLEEISMMKRDRIMVPSRPLAEALGFDVEWDDTARRVSFSNREHTVQVDINESELRIDGEAIEIDVASFIENGISYVPLRHIAEAFGLQVLWFADDQTVVIEN